MTREEKFKEVFRLLERANYLLKEIEQSARISYRLRNREPKSIDWTEVGSPHMSEE